jgi:zinc and cadmium transporter
MIAVFFLSIKKKLLSKLVLFLVSLSTGTLMGGAFLHLLPEGAENLDIEKMFVVVLLAFVFFFMMEKILHWKHCHKQGCEIHTFGKMSLFGDAIHNFIDGLIIASAFLVDIRLGFITTIMIASHEIPQEIGDFGVLIHAGYERRKALIMNFLVSLTVVLGAVVGYFINKDILIYLIPFAAGGFIYISASDLIPELRKEKDLKKSLLQFAIFLIGILIMYLVKFIH